MEEERKIKEVMVGSPTEESKKNVEGAVGNLKEENENDKTSPEDEDNGDESKIEKVRDRVSLIIN